MGALVVWNSLLNFLDQLLFYRLGFEKFAAVSRHFDASFDLRITQMERLSSIGWSRSIWTQ